MSSFLKRTGGEDFPDRLKVMISGPPKSGKTSFLGTVPNIVIADTEASANNLQSVAHLNLPYITVNSLADLQQLQLILSDATLRKQAAESLGMPEIEAVAIDTLDTLQQIMKRERLRETRQSQFLRDDWNWLKEEMAAIIRAFTALPLHVFFIVHTKTQELGKGDEARNIVLPALQGSISEDIAGMVGYSLLAFRKQEIHSDGSPYTKYWLRAEGDETYAFLGNRAAGRLPDVIEPHFKSLYDAAVAGRAAISNPPSVEAPTQAPAETPAQNAGQVKDDSDEPVNAAALSAVKKVYDAVGLTFPEETIKTLSMGDARTLVKMWKSIQADAARGVTDGDPSASMKSFLAEVGWLSEDKAPEAEIVPDLNGKIDQVLAYVEGDLAKVQEAYDLEIAKEKPRQTLVSALLSKGATEAQEVVTPESQDADSSEVDALVEAEQVVAEKLGGEVVTVLDSDTTAPCEKCGGAIDDQDVAVVSRTRFSKWLCVDCYIAETKAS
jgi:hypothetical protein